jgi:hypothetical protein
MRPQYDVIIGLRSSALSYRIQFNIKLLSLSSIYLKLRTEVHSTPLIKPKQSNYSSPGNDSTVSDVILSSCLMPSHVIYSSDFSWIQFYYS